MNPERYVELQFSLKEAQDQVAAIESVIDCFLRWYPDSEPHEPSNLRRELARWQGKVKSCQDAMNYDQQKLF